MMYTLTTVPLLLLAVASLAIHVASSQRTCYGRDGNTNDYRPCSSGADTGGHVACCNLPADTCLENGLCLWEATGGTFRNGCTDRSWNSFSCADRYLSLPDSCTEAAKQIFFCHERNDWCCGPVNNGTCCTSNRDHFTIGGFRAVAQSTASASTDSATTTPTGTPVRATATVTASFASTASANSCRGQMATGAGIGVGATAAVAVVLALGVGLLLRERRKAKKRDLARQMGEDMGQGIEATGPSKLPNEPQSTEGNNVGEMSHRTSVKAPMAELGGREVEEAGPFKKWRGSMFS